MILAESSKSFQEVVFELEPALQRLGLNVLARHDLPLCVTGYGSMMNLHARAEAPVDGPTGLDRDNALAELILLGLLQRGVYTAPRGMVNLSLPHTDDDLAVFCDRLDDTLGELVQLR